MLDTLRAVADEVLKNLIDDNRDENAPIKYGCAPVKGTFIMNCCNDFLEKVKKEKSFLLVKGYPPGTELISNEVGTLGYFRVTDVRGKTSGDPMCSCYEKDRYKEGYTIHLHPRNNGLYGPIRHYDYHDMWELAEQEDRYRDEEKRIQVRDEANRLTVLKWEAKKEKDD